MKIRILSAAVIAAGVMFGMGATAPKAEAGANFGVCIGSGCGYGYGYYPRYHRGYAHRHRHCHRVKAWRNGHRVWVRRCHSHRHGPGHHR